MKKFYLIDDDENIKGMLSNIIEGENLGIVVGEAADGLEGSQKWSFYKPDIIIIDYLMPNLDGSLAMEDIINKGFKGKFIMLSQVKDSTMKSNAYKKGAMFYLSKPINYIEVKTVLETVCKTIDLEDSLSLIKNTLTGLSNLNPVSESTPQISMIEAHRKLDKILGELGILGDAAKKEFKEVVLFILNLHGNKYILKDVYEEISSGINARSLEQKIRRLIQKALQNFAEIAIKDMDDPIYYTYRSTLFDITEVKKEIQFRKNKSSSGGKVSIKRFIEGIISILELHLQK